MNDRELLESLGYEIAPNGMMARKIRYWKILSDYTENEFFFLEMDDALMKRGFVTQLNRGYGGFQFTAWRDNQNEDAFVAEGSTRNAVVREAYEHIITEVKQ